MSIPGYDQWKLASPDDERLDDDEECPFCGAWTGQECGWDAAGSDENPPCIEAKKAKKPERDPDQWRDEREEARMDRENDR